MKLQKRTYITTGLVAVALSLVGILAYQLFYADLKNFTTSDIEKQQKQYATIAAGEIERYFYDIQKRLETMALSPAVRDAQRSESCNQQLQQLVELNSQELNNLGRVNKDGTFICAVNRTVIGEPVSKYGDYFAKVAADPKHRPAMSQLIVPSGSASSVIAVHVPVFDEKGQFNGTIGGAVYFDEMQKYILAGVKLTDNSTLALYDDNLNILYHPDPLIRGQKLTAPSIKGLYTPTRAIDTFIDDIKQAPAEGVVNYSFRDEQRRAVYKSAQLIGRYWTVEIAVPAKDSQVLIGRQFTQYAVGGLLVVVVLAGAALTHASLRRINRKTPAK